MRLSGQCYQNGSAHGTCGILGCVYLIGLKIDFDQSVGIVLSRGLKLFVEITWILLPSNLAFGFEYFSPLPGKISGQNDELFRRYKQQTSGLGQNNKLFGCPPHLPPAGEWAGGFLIF